MIRYCLWKGIVIITVMTIITLIGCGKQQKKSPLKIGVVIPLTGQWAPYGEQMRQGIDLAAENVNRAGGIDGTPVRVIYEDGEAKPAKSMQAFNKLINVDKVPAVISGFSTVILTLAAQANDNKVVLLNCGATSPQIAKAGPYVFTDIPNANYEASYLAEYLYKKLGYRKAAVFWQNNDAGIGMRNVFSKRFTELGGQIVGTLSHEQGQTNFRSLLSQLKKLNAQVVFIPTYSKEMGLILRQWKEMGLKAKVVGYAATEVKDLLDVAGNAAEGILYSYYAYDANSGKPKVKEFVVNFKAKYGKGPGLYSATFYDGAMLLFDAFKKGARTGPEIRDFLLSVKNYSGVSGTLTFDGKTSVVTPLQIKTVRHGKFVKYEPNR